jgi:hypothetical protein
MSVNVSGAKVEDDAAQRGTGSKADAKTGFLPGPLN